MHRQLAQVEFCLLSEGIDILQDEGDSDDSQRNGRSCARLLDIAGQLRNTGLDAGHSGLDGYSNVRYAHPPENQTYSLVPLHRQGCPPTYDPRRSCPPHSGARPAQLRSCGFGPIGRPG